MSQFKMEACKMTNNTQDIVHKFEKELCRQVHTSPTYFNVSINSDFIVKLYY
jgi:hypothetical protein